MKLDDIFDLIVQNSPRIKQVSGDYIPLPPGGASSANALGVNCVYREFTVRHNPEQNLVRYRMDALGILKTIQEHLADENLVSICLSFYEPVKPTENIRIYRTTV